MSPSHPPIPQSGPQQGRWLGRRRSFLVDKPYQLRGGLMTGVVVLILLVLLNVSLFSTRVPPGAEATGPALDLGATPAAVTHSTSTGQPQLDLLLVLLASVIILVGFFGMSILESHKTAGAAYSLRRRIEELSQGRLDVTLRLRKSDHLKPLEPEFNRMVKSLRERAWSDIEHIEALIEVASQSPANAELVRGLQDLSDTLRKRVDPEKQAADASSQASAETLTPVG